MSAEEYYRTLEATFGANLWNVFDQLVAHIPDKRCAIRMVVSKVLFISL